MTHLHVYDPDLDHWRWPDGSYVDRNGVMRHANGAPVPSHWVYIDLGGVRRLATGAVAPTQP